MFVIRSAYGYLVDVFPDDMEQSSVIITGNPKKAPRYADRFDPRASLTMLMAACRSNIEFRLVRDDGKLPTICYGDGKDMQTAESAFYTPCVGIASRTEASA
jgi:hypothetical protein